MRLVSGWIIHRARACAVAILYCERMRECVCIDRELGRGVKDVHDGCVRTKRASVCRGYSGGEREGLFSRVGLERGENGDARASVWLVRSSDAREESD